MWHDTNSENASTHRFPVDRINDEAADEIPPIPMLPLSIVIESTLEIMLVVAVILTIS